jgi:hypothetical protein
MAGRRTPAGRRTGQLKPAERLGLGDDLAHARLDALQVLGGERLGHVEVVVEAVLGWRPDAILRLRIQVGDGLGEHMGGGMAQHRPALLAGGGHSGQGGVTVQTAPEVPRLAVDQRGHRVHGIQQLGQSRAGGNLPHGAAGELDLELGHGCLLRLGLAARSVGLRS